MRLHELKKTKRQELRIDDFPAVTHSLSNQRRAPNAPATVLSEMQLRGGKTIIDHQRTDADTISTIGNSSSRNKCPVNLQQIEAISQSSLRQTRKRFVPRFLGKNMRDSAPIRPLRQQSLRRMCADNQGFVGTSLDQNQWLDPSGTTPSPEPHCQRQNLRRNEVGVTSAQPCKMIQLSANAPPLRLRGAAETEACILQDFYMPALCVCCETELFCIQDADYVLCPKCYGISPFDGNAPNRDQHILGGGIGLGFTFEDLSIIISRDL